MAHFLIYKRPVEVTSYSVDFSDLLTTPDTILDINLSRVVVVDSAGVDQSTYFVQKTTFSGLVMTAILQNGLDSEDYIVNFNGVGNSTSQLYNRILEVRVRSKLAGNI